MRADERSRRRRNARWILRRLRVETVAGRPDAIDLIAVLQTASGRVRSDAGMVFFNNPSVPGVMLAAAGAIDVVDGVLTVDGETRYSRRMSETMLTLDRTGSWIRSAQGAPVGRSKNRQGEGWGRYRGRL